MPRPARPLLVALAVGAMGLAGCQDAGEGPAPVAATEEDPAPGGAGETSTAAASASGASWGVGKTPLPGDEPEAEVVVSEAGPEPSTPPVRPPDPPPQEVVDRDDHVDFALDFLGRQATNSVDGLMGLYATRVRYFDRGTVPRAAVAEDKAAYFERWPNRYFEISGPVRASAGRRPAIRFDYAFAVSDAGGGGERTGRAWVELGLTPSTTGYVIASERGGTY